MPFELPWELYTKNDSLSGPTVFLNSSYKETRQKERELKAVIDAYLNVLLPYINRQSTQKDSTPFLLYHFVLRKQCSSLVLGGSRLPGRRYLPWAVTKYPSFRTVKRVEACIWQRSMLCLHHYVQEKASVTAVVTRPVL